MISMLYQGWLYWHVGTTESLFCQQQRVSYIIKLQMPIIRLGATGAGLLDGSCFCCHCLVSPALWLPRLRHVYPCVLAVFVGAAVVVIDRDACRWALIQ